MVQKDNINNKILIICGPTASGKSSLAIECAKLLDSEIICADSLTIYKGLNIGTAKITTEESQGIKHHLIDVVSPLDSFSVSDYKALAEPIVKDLLSRGKTPIICGGTGFYINSILYDLSYGNGSFNAEFRDKYKKLANEYGNEYVYNVLKEVDPESAEKLHYNDVKRVIRALEIYENGTKKSQLNDTLTPKYDYDAYFINFEREDLYSRINLRVDQMFELGLVNEIKQLLGCGVKFSNQCMQGIGYKEFADYFENNVDLEQIKDLIKLNTRHYAKRQLTFFKKLPNIQPLPCEDVSILAKRIVEKL